MWTNRAGQRSAIGGFKSYRGPSDRTTMRETGNRWLKRLRSSIVIRSGFAVLFVSYSLVTKRVSREVPLSRRGGLCPGRQYDPAERGHRGASSPPIHPFRRRARRFPRVRDVVCFSRGPDQHPLGGDTAALPVAAPALRSIPGQALPQGSIEWATVNGSITTKQSSDFTSPKPRRVLIPKTDVSFISDA